MSAKDSKNTDERAGRRPRRERHDEPAQSNYDNDAPIRNEEPKARRRRGAAEEAEADGKNGWMSSPNKGGGQEDDEREK